MLGSLPASALAQDASPTPDPSISPAAAPLPEGFNKKMVKQVEEVIKAVHPVRGLPPAQDVSYRVIDQETFLTELQALFREEYPAEYIAAEDAAYTRLGLLGPDDDLEKLILKIYDQQVLALANQDKDRIQQIALKTLGIKAKAEDITVDTRFVPTELMAAGVVDGGGAGRLAERYGPTAVLVGLSLAFLLLLSRWVKRPAAGGAAAPAGLVAGVSGAATASPEETVLLPANGEPSIEVKRQVEMRKRIEQLVQQDPANAAGLVSRWLNEG